MKTFNGFKAIAFCLLLGLSTFGLLIYSCDSNNDSDTISGFVMSGTEP